MQMLKPATLLKATLLHGFFSRFLNCTNGTKSCNASHIFHQLFSQNHNPLSKTKPFKINWSTYQSCSTINKWIQADYKEIAIRFITLTFLDVASLPKGLTSTHCCIWIALLFSNIVSNLTVGHRTLKSYS